MIALLTGIFGVGREATAEEAPMPREQDVQRFDFATFPFEHVTTNGAQALAEWEKLRNSGRGIPVILGGDEDLRFSTDLWQDGKPSGGSAALSKAEAFGKDFSIKAYRLPEYEQFLAQMKELGRAEGLSEESYEPEVGVWPDAVEPMNAPTVAHDILTGKPLDRVHIALLPAKASYEIPAYFDWGGWNANPPAEVHVAMLRKWADQYGAELVGMTGDVLNLRVERRPSSRDEALSLAQEMYDYCEDIVTQGTNDLATLAAILMESDYWYFWWD